MKLAALIPNLMVEDVKETLTWYRDVLDVRIDATVPDGASPVWAMVHRDDVTLMFQSRTSLGEELPTLQSAPIGASQTLYVQVEDVDDLRRQLDGKVTILSDLHDTFYGAREFYFADCNGYVFGFSQNVTSGLVPT